MKLRVMISLLLAAMLLSLLTGCAQPPVAEAEEEAPVANNQTEAPIPVVGEAHDYEVKIYGIDPNATEVEIPDESVPLASSYLDVSDGVSGREAEAIAIHHAGFRNSDVSYLYTKYEEDAEIPFYQVEFRHEGVPYLFRIDAANGEILQYQKGE